MADLKGSRITSRYSPEDSEPIFARRRRTDKTVNTVTPSDSPQDTSQARRRVTCQGVVQGVGFRPAVHRLATDLELSGWVRNDAAGVTIEVEGPTHALDAFSKRLQGALPPLARILALDEEDIPVHGDTAFEVIASKPGSRKGALLPPDSRICDACLRDLEDPGNRRYGYAFTTCTDCGPRYSLASSLPYDRARTSMACFPLCPRCAAEYGDLSDRRYHAEPLSCPDCGPRIWLVDGEGRQVAEGPGALGAARAALTAGLVVAVKGLGGFQVACRADHARAVERLRLRKRRPTRPFAVMVPDLRMARRLVNLSPEDEALLLSPTSPVLLAPRRAERPGPTGEPGQAWVDESVAPGLGDLGVMLPTTPLHHLLFFEAPYPALVMTSGNLSGEPIACGNREALARLGSLSDRLLFHDRDVLRRVDDSVARSTPRGPVLLRRSRGYVPAPLPLPQRAPRPVLGLGAHLQATCCVAVDRLAFLSPHVGDQEDARTRRFLEESLEALEQFLQARGEVIVVDLHPDYASTRLGERLALRPGASLLAVQHHLAHASAVLAEHGRFPQAQELAAALILDGTGYGTDGTAWGAECLLLDGQLRWRRLASMQPLPLVGGEAAVREPWRVAVAALVTEGEGALLKELPLSRLVDQRRLEQIAWLAGQPSWPLASGAGRLFEAAGALLGLAAVNGYEGEAALRLEALAGRAWSPELPPWGPLPDGPSEPVPRLPGTPLPDGPGKLLPRLPGARLLVELARRSARGEPPSLLAAGFHSTFSAWAAALVGRVLPPEVRLVALGGGCLANRLLREDLSRGLSAQGREVLLPGEVPSGDGGIAYGQAVLGALAEARCVTPSESEGS